MQSRGWLYDGENCYTCTILVQRGHALARSRLSWPVARQWRDEVGGSGSWARAKQPVGRVRTSHNFGAILGDMGAARGLGGRIVSNRPSYAPVLLCTG
jgi:hypothetical protein